MEAKEIINALMSGKIDEEQAARLIESFKKPKVKPVKTGKRGRPTSKVKDENYKIILTLWVAYSDIQPGFKMKLRHILADGLKVEDSYVSKCIARINGLVKSGQYHIYKGIDSNNRLHIMALDNAGLNFIQTSPKEAEESLIRGDFLPVRWSI